MSLSPFDLFSLSVLGGWLETFVLVCAEVGATLLKQ